MSMNIAFIGLGIMGRAMAANLLKAGHHVTVYNRTKERTGALAEAGANVAETAKAAASGADAVVLMLTGPEATDAVLEGPDGALEGLGAGVPVVNMSTVSPEYARAAAERLAKCSVTYVDAPVSGSKVPAEQGTLIILAGGPRDVVDGLEPAFLAMGQKVIYCGDAGTGSDMKMVVNLLLGVMMEGFCEALNLGRRLGLTTQAVFDTILSGPLGCGLFNLKTKMLETDDYPTQFPFKHMTKDMRFVLQTADQAGAPAPLATALFQVMRQGVGKGLGDLDFAAVMRVLEEMNDA